MLELLLISLVAIIFGGGTVWLYYRNKFTNVLNELEDKKVIIKTIHQHSDEIERQNVKKIVKNNNTKVAKKSKDVTKKPRKNAVKK